MLFVAVLQALCRLAQQPGGVRLCDALLLAHPVQQRAVGQELRQPDRRSQACELISLYWGPDSTADCHQRGHSMSHLKQDEEAVGRVDDAVQRVDARVLHVLQDADLPPDPPLHVLLLLPVPELRHAHCWLAGRLLWWWWACGLTCRDQRVPQCCPGRETVMDGSPS